MTSINLMGSSVHVRQLQQKKKSYLHVLKKQTLFGWQIFRTAHWKFDPPCYLKLKGVILKFLLLLRRRDDLNYPKHLTTYSKLRTALKLILRVM